MYHEEELLPISGLQHIMFCERQCALIHLEGIWSENWLTAKGRIMHENTHDERISRRRGVRVERGMAIRSLELGLTGKADVVEFHSDSVFPVEYKRGKPKANDCDRVQLCAQALCLEEMLGRAIWKGALFYSLTRRRLDVVFDDGLRQITHDSARRFHTLVRAGDTPKAVYSVKCESCSLIEDCLPKMTNGRKSALDYLANASKDDYENIP